MGHGHPNINNYRACAAATFLYQSMYPMDQSEYALTTDTLSVLWASYLLSSDTTIPILSWMICILPPEWSFHSRFLHISLQRSGSPDFQDRTSPKLSGLYSVIVTEINHLKGDWLPMHSSPLSDLAPFQQCYNASCSLLSAFFSLFWLFSLHGHGNPDFRTERIEYISKLGACLACRRAMANCLSCPLSY